jgi:uncharacterized membrane protein
MMRQHIEKYQALKILETEVKILGIQFSEFKYLLFEVLFVLVAPSFSELIGVEPGTIFYAIVFAFMLATYIMLRRTGKHKYKNYFASVISFRINQPKMIRVAKDE